MKIYVGNLPFSVNSEKLKELFSEYGDIEEATIITDKFSGRSKGFGFVTFSKDDSAKKAIKAMNDKEVDGRKLKVNEAKPMEERPARKDFRERRRF
ncbi:MAG: RNA-binding protein [Candidatus Pacearchaeota archaeon]